MRFYADSTPGLKMYVGIIYTYLYVCVYVCVCMKERDRGDGYWWINHRVADADVHTFCICLRIFLYNYKGSL